MNQKKMSFLKFEKLSKFHEIEHFIATRKSGISQKPYDSMNLSIHVGDDDQHVVKNRSLLADNLGINTKDLVFPLQTHSKNVAIYLGTKEISQKVKGFGEIRNTDAIITGKSKKCILVTVADCVPILLYEPRRKIIGVVHAGWRGTMKEITKVAVEKMTSNFNCDPSQIIAGIGPSIGPCCYEVINEELYKKWQKIYPKNTKIFVKRDQKTFLDLWQANVIQMRNSGVREENIEVSGICTGCNTDKFYSYRAEGVTGRFGVGIMLK